MKLQRQWKPALLHNGQALWPTLYLTALALYGAAPWKVQPITAFDRVMGAATAAGVQVSGRTGGALLVLLVQAPLLALAFWWLVSLCLQEKKAAPNTAHGPQLAPLISVCSGMGLCLLAAVYVQSFGGEEPVPFTLAQSVALTIVTALLVWCAFRRALPPRVQTVAPQTVWRGLLCALPLTFVQDLVIGWGMPLAYQYAFAAVLVVGSCMLFTLCRPLQARQRAMTAAGLPLLLCLPAVLLYLELTQILNQYGVQLGDRRLPVTAIAAACAAAAAAVFAVQARRPDALRPAEKDWKRLWYPLLLVSLSLLAAQPELQSYVSSDFFERANGAVSISGFLNFGQLPAVETHGAHMLSDYVGGIFWGLVNGDSLAACFTSYSGISLALTTLVFYALLRSCIGTDAAFAAALLLPITGINLGDWYAHLSYLPALALVWLLQKKSFGRYAAFWASAAFSVLYRGDVGLAVGLSAVAVLLIHTALQKSGREWKCFCLGGLAVGGPLAALLAVLCLARGISPLSRLWEFLQLMAFSNQNWAYEKIGTVGTAGLVWTYLVTPVLILALLAAALLRVRRGAQTTAAHWLFYVFAGGYFLNFPRTLVRHSLMENIPVYCLSVGVWALALGLWLLWKTPAPAARSGRVALPLLLMTAIMLSSALFDSGLTVGTSLVDRVYARFADGQIIDYQLIDADGSVTRVRTVEQPMPRVVLSEWMQSVYQPLQAEMDRLLGDGETWLDFTNQSTLYAILGRPSPVFVNQSPGLLSGEYTQQAFIEEIEAQAERVPVALLPQSDVLLSFSLDGVPNALRYYRVAEYMYTHYTPYETVGRFAIWVRNGWQPPQEGAAAEASLQADFSRLQPVNASIQTENGVLTVQPTAEDPQLHRFETVLNGAADGETLNLTLEYTSGADGVLQLFYAQPNRNFEEESSVRAAVQKTDSARTVTLSIPWNRSYRLRLDTPDHTAFTIQSVSVAQSAATLCGYDYAGHDQAHVYPMGEIARLWGMADTAHAAENPESAALVALGGGRYDVPARALGGEKGRYVKLVLTGGEEETTATLSLCRREGSAASLADFTFTVAPGTAVYLVRVSCDSYWYSGMVDTLQLSAAGVQVESIALLEGD